MKKLERDGLLFLLAAVSGSADAWSYFGLGHAFVANMTGNTVLLGVSVFHLHSDFLHPLIALACYLLGAVAGTLLSRRVEPGALWSRVISWTLFIEAMFLIGSEIAWVSMSEQPGSRAQAVLLACLAAAIGMQSAAMVQLRVPGIVTTYITGTWTTLTNGLTLLAARQPNILREEKRYEERFALQGAVLAAYLLSAVLTGWAFRHESSLVGAIPACLALLVAAWGALRS